jgi:hypothetical protein
MTQPTIDELRKLLEYDPETGSLTWKERPRSMFKRDRHHEMWNTRYAGKQARGKEGKRRYSVKVVGSKIHLGRVCWALHNGDWPKGQVIFKNDDPADTRANNMICGGPVENGRYRGLNAANKSGVKGVSFHRKSRRWRAMIDVRGKKIALGSFSNIEEAAQARKEAESKYWNE